MPYIIFFWIYIEFGGNRSRYLKYKIYSFKFFLKNYKFYSENKVKFPVFFEFSKLIFPFFFKY